MPKILKNIILSILVLSACFTTASASVVDSLLIVLSNTGMDEKKADVCNEIAAQYYSSEPQKSFEYTKKAIKLAEKSGYTAGLAESYNLQASYHYLSGNFNEALTLYSKSLQFFSDLSDSASMAMCYNNIGGLKLKLGDITGALTNFITAAKIYEALSDAEGSAILYNNIGVICRKQELPDEALKYYDKALLYFSRLSDNPNKASVLHNMGSIFHDKGDFPGALEYLQQALDIRILLDDKIGLAKTMQGIGTVYLSTNEYPKAIENFKKALDIRTELKDISGQSHCLNQIAVLYARQNLWNEARTFFSRSLDLSMKSGLLENQKFTYSWLADIDSIQGDYYAALKNYELYKEINDSIINTQKINELTKIRKNFEDEKKEKQQQIEILSYENRLNQARLKNHVYIFLLILTCMAIAVLAIILAYKKYKRKSGQIIIELKQENLKQQINPHFICNSLNSIQSAIYRGNKTESSACLTKLARLMRMILENSQSKSIPIQDELDTLKLYLDLMCSRFKNKIEYSIVVDENLDTLTYKIPSLLLQPFVENSIVHGFRNKRGKGKIKIELVLEENSISCHIEDNGIGRNKPDEEKIKPLQKHRSLGSRISEDRLKLLNSLYGKNINVHFEDLKDSYNKPAGTRVNFQLPLLN
ncbi:MAG: tetratricopeptide repeat protein [Bacteroidales bacterium]|nr:tetratricopeptide repeat protein [Bacteroidales bacterium]